MIPLISILTLSVLAITGFMHKENTSMGEDIRFKENPIITNIYTADPAPMVYKDRLYLYTTHDEDELVNDFYTMNDWRCFSTTDMVNWTDHGVIFSLDDIEWADARAWAPQAVERNGKFYLYCPVHKKNGGMAIAVGISDKPEGPYTDLGYPLVDEGDWNDIDPTVFIDDDGKAYLYWGNPQLYSAQLSSSMTSLLKEPNAVDMTTEAFGGYKENDNIIGGDCYEEGPWLTKYGDTYYLVYAAGGVPEHIAYSTSSSPLGPWKYRGTIMPTQGGSFTNHPGVVEYKGHWYFFYHNGALPRGGGFTRSVCVEEFKFNEDGTFPTINMTTKGPNPIGTLNPYVRQEAETMAASGGTTSDGLYIRSGVDTDRGVYIKDIDNGDYIRVREVDFGESGAKSLKLCVKGSGIPTQVRVQMTGTTGYIALVNIPTDLTDWGEVEVDLSKTITGKHDVTFTFYTRQSSNKNNLCLYDWWQFSQETVAINDISADNEQSATNSYYTLDGRRVNAIGKGITIMRKADGKAVKVMNR